jgi:hypothetical protein
VSPVDPVAPVDGFEHAERLQEIIEEGREVWPLRQEQATIDQISEWIAFSESDADALARLCNWQRGTDQNLPYVPDPLAERIKEAFADLLFGGTTTFEVPVKKDDPQAETQASPDQVLLDGIVEENELSAELQSAAADGVAEGEVWWRIYVDKDAFEHPVIEWHSRVDVVPLWRGRKLLAAAFVSDLRNLAADAPVTRVGDDNDPPGTRQWREHQTSAGEDEEVWRYVEIQAGGLIRNLLYRGGRQRLGTLEPLDAHDETAGLPDEWVHGLEVPSQTGTPVPLMLAGRVTNGRGGRLGRSQYAGIKHLLYELNKVTSIGSRNVDLTMQKRAVLSAEMVAELVDPDLPTGTRKRARLPDAFLTPGEGSDQMGDQPLMGVLEFSDAWADALLAWKGGLVDDILTRARVAPQLVGRHTEDAATGPALRARLLDSILAANGKGTRWDDGAPNMLRAAQMVDALPEEQGGCGHQWTDPTVLPVVTRSSVLPEDEGVEIVNHSTAVGAKLESRRTAIERLNPEWDDKRVNEEMALIDEDPLNQPPPQAPPGAPPNGPPQPPPPANGVTAGGGNGAVEGRSDRRVTLALTARGIEVNGIAGPRR